MITDQNKLMVACKPDSLNILPLASVSALESRQLPVSNPADTECLTYSLSKMATL